jgi:hypothetical protein
MQEINLYKNIFPTSQKTHVLSLINTNLLMRLWEIFRFLSDNRVDQLNDLCGQSAVRCPEC